MERVNSDETKQGTIVVQRIMDWCSSKTPTIHGLDFKSSLEDLRRTIANMMCFSSVSFTNSSAGAVDTLRNFLPSSRMTRSHRPEYRAPRITQSDRKVSYVVMTIS
jgi:hypothetical protein